MGTMLIILTVYVALYLAFPIFKFIKNDSKCGKRQYKKLRPVLFWTHAILFVQEGFMDILIASAVNLFYINEGELKWETWSLAFTNTLSIFMVACCGILVIFILGYLLPRFDNLSDKTYEYKYFPAYEMLNLKNGRWTFMWPILFFARRVLFVIAVCAVVDYAVVQILMWLVPTLIVMIMTPLAKPLIEHGSNSLETYNQFSILAMTYCVMCFT